MQQPTSPIGPGFAKKSATFSHKGFRGTDPFAPRRKPVASFFNALLATALIRCWHILLFFGAWSTLITVLNEQGHELNIQATLLTVVGTVLGFVISYRTTSSFERYNEGRMLWSQIIFASRTLARTVWFHVPDSKSKSDQDQCHTLIEKKTIVNLIWAYSVAVKHYLRGEDGIYYRDLYYLVKFLPAYALPPGRPYNRRAESPRRSADGGVDRGGSLLRQQISSPSYGSDSALPLPVSSSTQPEKEGDKVILRRQDERFLLPADCPPHRHIFDGIPLLGQFLTTRGKKVDDEEAASFHAKMREAAVSHNLPLEISLYLSSYIAALQMKMKKELDDPTTNTLLNSLNILVDSLTGLERIITTPIPFSYSIHLWVVTLIYCFFLPFQIWQTMGWVTIPGTVVISFMFFGFLVAGEEIENPFGYDQNDLNLHHFTHNIIGNELRAITSTPPPNPDKWVFNPENDMLFTPHNDSEAERVTPEGWIKRGLEQMQGALSVIN